MRKSWSQFVKPIESILYKISNILIRDFNGLNGVSSETLRNKLVGNIDEKIEYILTQELQRIEPDIPILFEGYKKIEGTDEKKLFIIDPVDGTANFQNGNKDFSVSIALQNNGETVLGMVMFPVVNELFVAIKDEGVYFIDMNENKIRVKTINKMTKSRMFLMTRTSMFKSEEKFSILQHFVNHKMHLRCIGCVSMDMAMLACGRAQVIIYDTTKIWDIVAGELIIKEAGGLIYKHNDYFIAATSPRLIDEIKELLPKKD